MFKKSFSLALATALVISGCAKSEDGDESDAASMALESVVGNLNSALSDGEQSASIASSGASCGIDRYSPAVGSSNCAGTLNHRTVQSVLNGCTDGSSGEYSMSGTITLSFDSSSTCDEWINGGTLPATGSVVRTSSDLSRTNPNGSVVSTSSEAHENYAGTSISGGVRTTYGASSRSVEILGLHRVRTSARGAVVFDHSIRTLSAITVSGSQAAGDRAISSGSVRVDHNRARYSMTTSVSGLSWTSSCCHPVSGQMVFTLSGSLSGTMTADFNTGTCGEVTLTRTDGSVEKAQLAACDG